MVVFRVRIGIGGARLYVARPGRAGSAPAVGKRAAPFREISPLAAASRQKDAGAKAPRRARKNHRAGYDPAPRLGAPVVFPRRRLLRHIRHNCRTHPRQPRPATRKCPSRMVPRPTSAPKALCQIAAQSRTPPTRPSSDGEQPTLPGRAGVGIPLGWARGRPRAAAAVLGVPSASSGQALRTAEGPSTRGNDKAGACARRFLVPLVCCRRVRQEI